MAIEVVPHAQEHADAVEAFNARMRAGGSEWGFYVNPVPEWMPHEAGATTWREYHLAMEDGEHVRGGYALKPQQWLIRGQQTTVADWQGPFTEAEINPRFAPLMLRLARAAEKQYENLFSLGHSEKDAAVLTRLGWGTKGVPFCFFINRPAGFFRQAAYLRNSRLKSFACDVLAYSGIGALMTWLLQAYTRLRHRQTSNDATAEVVDSFGDWADELWDAHKGAYRCLAIRDRATMNRLVPSSGWPGGIRLKVVVDGETVGWSVVLVKDMQNDHRYGDMRVGLIADVFGHPEQSAAVIAATVKYLQEVGVDMICCHVTHPQWIDGCRASGFTVLPDRRIFAFSKALRSRLDPFDDLADGLHLTNLDGHGPHGFTAQD